MALLRHTKQGTEYKQAQQLAVCWQTRADARSFLKAHQANGARKLTGLHYRRAAGRVGRTHTKKKKKKVMQQISDTHSSAVPPIHQLEPKEQEGEKGRVPEEGYHPPPTPPPSPLSQPLFTSSILMAPFSLWARRRRREREKKEGGMKGRKERRVLNLRSTPPPHPLFLPPWPGTCGTAAPQRRASRTEEPEEEEKRTERSLEGR